MSHLQTMYYSPTCGFLFIGHKDGKILVYEGPNMVPDNSKKDFIKISDEQS